MDLKDQLDHERRHLAYAGEVLEQFPALTRARSTDGASHRIAWSALAPDTADAAIAAEIEHHRRLGVAFEWKLYAHDAPANLRDRLRVHGFSIGPREAVMVFDLPGAVKPDPACRVVRIERSEQLDDYRRVAEEVFHKRYDLTTGQLATALAAGSSQHRGYVAYFAGEAVSVGRLYTHPDSRFAGLYGGGTRAPFRGRGFYRAVVAARAHDAVALGAQYAIVDALPTSRPILERLGYRHLTDTWPCEWQP